jgi:hypothetical protein
LITLRLAGAGAEKEMGVFSVTQEHALQDLKGLEQMENKLKVLQKLVWELLWMHLQKM